MDHSACDEASTTGFAHEAAGIMRKSAFVVDLFHNIQHFRVGSELCPGKRGADWRVGDLAVCGHISMLHIQLAQLAAASDQASLLEECSCEDANEAAKTGLVDVIRDLRAYGIHCTSRGADEAARNGHLDMIQDLRANGIHCTYYGANLAAVNGHIGVVRDLRAQNIHCTSFGADMAAGNGHLDVVRDLRAHGIHGSIDGANLAAFNQHAEVVRDLEAHGIVGVHRRGPQRAVNQQQGIRAAQQL